MPAWCNEAVARVALALGPLLREHTATSAALAGVSERFRMHRVATRLSTAGRPAIAAAESALLSTSARLGLPEPPLYFRPDQNEPLRVEPTSPLSFVLGPALEDLGPAASVFLATAAAAKAAAAKNKKKKKTKRSKPKKNPPAASAASEPGSERAADTDGGAADG